MTGAGNSHPGNFQAQIAVTASNVSRIDHMSNKDPLVEFENLIRQPNLVARSRSMLLRAITMVGTASTAAT